MLLESSLLFTATLVLVGTKTDLRTDTFSVVNLAQKNEEPIESEDGEKLKKKLNVAAYLECSAKQNEGVHEVFETAISTTLKGKKGKCITM